MVCVSSVKYKNPWSQRFSHVFFPESHVFYIYVCDPFWISFCIRYETQVQVHSFAYKCLGAAASLAEKTVLSIPPLNCFLHLWETSVAGMLVWIYSWVLFSIPLIYVCLSFSQYHTVLSIVGKVTRNNKWHDSSHFSSFSSILFNYFRNYNFLYKFLELTCLYLKFCILHFLCILHRNCIKPIDQLGKNWHLD